MRFDSLALLSLACLVSLFPPQRESRGQDHRVSSPPPTTARLKKLIEFGWDEPDTAFLRSRVRELERTPFDGTVFHVVVRGAKGNIENFAWLCWGKRSFTLDEVRPAIDDLTALRSTRLKHNFLRFNTTPADLDWFDDHGAVIANARLAARIARSGSCDGILLDTEQYQGKLFDYPKQKLAKERRWAEYAAQAARRGSEVMTAFQEGYPDLTVLVTFGHSYLWKKTDGGKKSLADCECGLLVPFLDGMIAATKPRARIVDGHELSYGFRDPEQFETAERVIKSDAAALATDPEAYRRAISAGFGLWLDYNWPENGWSASKPAKNYFSPARFEQSLRAAIDRSSEYVWIYTEKCRWWSNRGGAVDLPEAYIEAVARSRRDLIGR
jgi:hypothetical protein